MPASRSTRRTARSALKETADYESSDLGLGPDKAYNVTVQATEEDDGNPQTLERTGRLAVTVAVTDVNEPPTITENATPSVDENTTAVATYRATDPDERATITWSVEDPGAGDFTITNAGALSFASAPNYEVKSSYTVTVRASDGTNDVPHDVTVTVTDVNETGGARTLSHRTPLIGEEVTAAFEEGTGDNVDNVQPPTWAWARSTSKTTGFTTISGAAAATYLPAGDDRERYLRVTVSYNDGHGQGRKTLSATSEFATAATRASNTPPMFPDPLFTGVQAGLSVRENAGVRTVVGVAPEATDMQGGGLSYSLAVSGFTSDPPFEINPTSRQIRVAPGARLNHERQNTYGVTVTVVDEFDAPATATFDITIEDVNEPPVAVADPAVTTRGGYARYLRRPRERHRPRRRRHPDRDHHDAAAPRERRAGHQHADADLHAGQGRPQHVHVHVHGQGRRTRSGGSASPAAQVTVTVNLGERRAGVRDRNDHAHRFRERPAGRRGGHEGRGDRR